MNKELLKKIPKQVRSKERLKGILKAAEDLALSGGFEAATTSEIAQRAGIPVGSFYQFFDDRDTMFEYLYIEAYNSIEQAQIKKAEELLGQTAWDEFIKKMLQNFWRVARDHKSFRVLTRWHNATRPLLDATANLEGPMGQMFEKFIILLGFEFPENKRSVILNVMIANLSLCIDLAIEEKDETQASLFMEEAIEMVLRYIGPYAPQ
ncbi:TetR/AcrR family transcriptional regulator [Temperatibacter marinus]|uniref:TetR/AcrR family transcriptional regulator n=1 Tax=Temperatibacter marinus TaxID=1456591 RepID=A0AA52HAH2_9PROT|nr:TetR/AcrR family transcriptional regulator [Temperatibacter marinus]WND03622.1 TetR/AcrR family transcriptional regulator [Temperatibacter marinus]